MTKPVNELIGPRDLQHTVKDLEACGVRRLSLGGTLARAAYSAARDAAAELLGPGTLTFARALMSSSEINRVMTGD